MACTPGHKQAINHVHSVFCFAAGARTAKLVCLPPVPSLASTPGKSLTAMTATAATCE